MYLSNLQKKEHLSKYLTDILQKDVIIKNYYKSMSDFSNGVAGLKSVSFVTKRTLFTEPDGIFNAVADVFGLDCTEELHIKAEYGRKALSDIGHNFLNRIESQRNNSQIENVVVCGYDDNDVEKTLDVNNYIESISVNVEPEEESGMLSDVEVKQALMNKLEG